MWLVSVSHAGLVDTKLLTKWLALITLPWMAIEMNLLDLKATYVKQYSRSAHKLHWINGKQFDLFYLTNLNIKFKLISY